MPLNEAGLRLEAIDVRDEHWQDDRLWRLLQVSAFLGRSTYIPAEVEAECFGAEDFVRMAPGRSQLDVNNYTPVRFDVQLFPGICGLINSYVRSTILMSCSLGPHCLQKGPPSPSPLLKCVVALVWTP